MQNKILAPLLLVATLLLSGCDQGSAAANEKIAELEKRLEEIDQRLAHNARMDVTVDSSVATLLGKENMFTRAYLTPTGSGFEVIKTEYGSITVSIKDIRPYADGSQATFSIGNPLAANVSPYTLVVEYGPPWSDKYKSVPEWQAQTRKTVHTPTAPLEAGAWNIVKVNLPGIKPEALGRIEVYIEASGLSMRTDN
jgi:hypothetical protein